MERLHENDAIYDSSWIRINNKLFLVFITAQDLFSKQKGYLEEELDYRKQALDQAYMVGKEQSFNFHVWTDLVKYFFSFYFKYNSLLI